MSFIMPAATAHGMVLGIMEHVEADPQHVAAMTAAATSPAAIAQRVDWILNALAAAPAPAAEEKPKKTKTKKRA
jgi:hypothetical protein